MGFEPTVPFRITGFQDQLLKPLGHLSIYGMSAKNIISQFTSRVNRIHPGVCPLFLFAAIEFPCKMVYTSFCQTIVLYTTLCGKGFGMQQELEQLKGEVEGIVYYNEDTGFSVLDFDVGGELVCVSASLPTSTRAKGWCCTAPLCITHLRAAVQAVACEHQMPSSANAI